DGYFFLEGFSPDGKTYGLGTRAEIETIKADIPIDNFDPANILDGRKHIIRSIVQRQGQGKFRQELVENFGCCAVSGCTVIDVLEAAHIIPYQGIHTNMISNGLLLRADIHTLFDLGLISIDPQSMTVLVSPKLDNTPYSTFKGKPISLPQDGNVGPSKEALQEHRKWANL
ncbi:MAG TPA: HNH endonuclease, partial [Ktedonobacteraceae bacterium]|nr:HNH endonuclease [Ktedonobacteraceae bacterium]